jgi:hypothetical protein
MAQPGALDRANRPGPIARTVALIIGDPDAGGLFATESALSSPVIIEQARHELGTPPIRYCGGALPDLRGLVSTLRLKPLASRGQPGGRRAGRRPERC